MTHSAFYSSYIYITRLLSAPEVKAIINIYDY